MIHSLQEFRDVLPYAFIGQDSFLAWAPASGFATARDDIRGVREQVGDAGILVDPRFAEAIAESIQQLWNDNSLCKNLANRGRQRLLNYTPEDFRRRLANIPGEAKERVRQAGMR